REPFIFERGRQLARVAQNKVDPDGSSHPVIDALSKDALTGELARTAWYVNERRTRNGDTVRAPISPPKDIVNELHARGSWDNLPSLAGVVETPVVRPDGSILIRPGYDDTTWLYYAPRPGFILPPIPDRPVASAVEEAVDLLGEALCDFPFEDSA